MTKSSHILDSTILQWYQERFCHMYNKIQRPLSVAKKKKLQEIKSKTLEIF